MLRQLFGGATGKVATAAPDWNNTRVVSAAFKKKFGAGDASARLDACALSEEERAMRFSELSACARRALKSRGCWPTTRCWTSSRRWRRDRWRGKWRGARDYVRQHALKRSRRGLCPRGHRGAPRPSWLFPTAVATSCWQDDGKKPPKPTGVVRYGCLVMLNGDRIAAAAPPRRNPNLYEPPRVTLQMRRAPYYHYAPFEKHHYLCGGVQDGAWCFEVRRAPVGFHAVQSAFGEVGCGRRHDGREPRAPRRDPPRLSRDGLGWQMSDRGDQNFTARAAWPRGELGRRFMSITMHHTFGGGRDRSERWRPKPKNHAADKYEAIQTSSSATGAAGGRPRGADAARPPPAQLPPRVRGRGRRARESTSGQRRRHPEGTNARERGCSHCYSNHDMVCRRIKCLDSKKKKLPKKDLEGTLWGTPPARPLGVAPPPTVDVSKRREPPALTKRLEKVEVVGGRGPKRQAAAPKGSTKAKKVAEKARARDTGGRDWTFDRRKKAWVVCAADAADFTLDHEAVGDEVRATFMEKRWTGRSWASPRARRGAAALDTRTVSRKTWTRSSWGWRAGRIPTWQNKLAKGARAAARRAEAQGAREAAAKRRKPRYEDDDDEAFTASAPARAGGRRVRAGHGGEGEHARGLRRRGLRIGRCRRSAPAPRAAATAKTGADGAAPRVQEGGPSRRQVRAVVPGHGRRPRDPATPRARSRSTRPNDD